MRPAARRARASGSTDMIVGAVTVALEEAFEVAQEPLGTFAFPAKPEVKDHRSGRMTVLPEVSLVVFAPAIVHLNCHGGFIGLDISSRSIIPGPSLR